MRGGSALTTFMPWPATWLRIRWSRKSGTTTSCEKSPGWIRSSSFQVREPPSGSSNSIAHISPRPRTSRTTAELSASARALKQRVAEPGASLDQALLVELAQRREAGDHRQVVRGKRRAVADGVRERVEDTVVDLRAHQQCADRYVAARERLGDRDQVGLETPVLQGEHPPRASEPGLDLVDAEERAVATAELLCSLQVVVGRQVDALALHRLDEEERDILLSEL